MMVKHVTFSFCYIFQIKSKQVKDEIEFQGFTYYVKTFKPKMETIRQFINARSSLVKNSIIKRKYVRILNVDLHTYIATE